MTLCGITTTDWYNNLKLTPGDTMRIYRENAYLTQAQLGTRTAGLSLQAVSGMEHGKRPIRLDVAEKLAGIFKVPVHRFTEYCSDDRK